ncbi:helix-turn-helix transcriptional regulator [Phaeobacter sp. HF9A]|uniref:helix-turn-helix transcriptional regulator n=1 Tax=Phaeobacter sp. HF9A TaxID=2721561 RepID=UPI001430ADC8|nr:helix-turn-helix transcriptional regulator [Phaeobacter sp. HF9A]NIZ11997.1 helix-turn-helix transcriptional regulator [Phaeobacter sp. HF9A]
MHELCWETGSPGELRLPDQSGQMKFYYREGGMSFVTSSIKTDRDTQINFSSDTNVCQLSAQYFIAGDAQICLGTGATYNWRAGTAMLIRADSPGFHLKIGAGQVLRHVCISMHCDYFRERVKTDLSAGIGELFQREKPVDVGIPLRTTEPLKVVANELYNCQMEGELEALRSDLIAKRFLVEALAIYGKDSAEAETDISPVTDRHRDILAKIKRRIEAVPTLGLGELLSQYAAAGTPSFLRHLFQVEYGISMSAFQRNLRLSEARRMLETQDVHVKQVAFASGYSQIGNFTRAYRNQFGEAPSSTRKRVQGY